MLLELAITSDYIVYTLLRSLNTKKTTYFEHLI